MDCSTLPLIRTLYYWVLSKEVSSTIFKVLGMTQTGIEPRSPRPLANTQPTSPMSRYIYIYISIIKRNLKKIFFKFFSINVNTELIEIAKMFVLRILTSSWESKLTSGLNRGLSSKLWWLRSANKGEKFRRMCHIYRQVWSMFSSKNLYKWAKKRVCHNESKKQPMEWKHTDPLIKKSCRHSK